MKGQNWPVPKPPSLLRLLNQRTIFTIGIIIYHNCFKIMERENSHRFIYQRYYYIIADQIFHDIEYANPQTLNFLIWFSYFIYSLVVRKDLNQDITHCHTFLLKLMQPFNWAHIMTKKICLKM